MKSAFPFNAESDWKTRLADGSAWLGDDCPVRAVPEAFILYTHFECRACGLMEDDWLLLSSLERVKSFLCEVYLPTAVCSGLHAYWPYHGTLVTPGVPLSDLKQRPCLASSPLLCRQYSLALLLDRLTSTDARLLSEFMLRWNRLSYPLGPSSDHILKTKFELFDLEGLRRRLDHEFPDDEVLQEDLQLSRRELHSLLDSTKVSDLHRQRLLHLLREQLVFLI